jgi:thiol-disulfide isomerase/thioredoxin
MSKRNRYCRAALGAVFGAALAVSPAVVGAQEQGFTPVPVLKGVKSLETGMLAPDFTVKDVEGNVFHFAEHRNQRAHVLVFWSIFCEPCREEMPVIERLANEYRSEGKVEFITVNMDGEPFLDGIKGFLKQYKYSLRVILDELDAKGEQFAIADPYQVAGTPVLYLINAEGKIAGSHLGRIGEGDLRAMIAGMLGAK